MGIKNTLYVNLYGGPGTGKSTMMASIFSELKWKGIDCEMVTEYAKDKVWEDSLNVLDDQLYVTAKQYHRLFRLNGKVDVVITDSPLLLGVIYNDLYKSIKIPEFNELIYKISREFNNLDIFLHREKQYNPNGRLQTEDESKKLDFSIRYTLEKYKIKVISVLSNKESIKTIINIINKNIKLNNN